MDGFENLQNNLFLLTNAMKKMGSSAIYVTAAIQKLSNAMNNLFTKEYRSMETKLILMQARLQTLDGRNTECEAIRKKLRRQIRNLKAKMAETLIAQ
jgi:HAMP domain-containing protein